MKDIQVRNKVSSDVSLEEWENLALAADELLGLCRLLWWIDQGQENMDASCLETINNMASALSKVGLTPLSQEEAEKKLVEILSGTVK